MKYDMAKQFLKRLHFSPIANDYVKLTNEYGERICYISEWWGSDIDSHEKCINLEHENEYDDEPDLPF